MEEHAVSAEVSAEMGTTITKQTTNKQTNIYFTYRVQG